MVKGIVPWKNFDELEDNLILDEFLLLHDVLSREEKMHYKILGSFQGINMDEDEDDNSMDSDDELPEEMLAAERAWKEKRDKGIAEGLGEASSFEAMGLGYTRE